MSQIELREAGPDDQTDCGRILYAAFLDIAERHRFPPDFATPEIAHGVMGFVLKRSYGVVAEREGRVLGSNFLSETDEVSAVGPISVDPEIQESGIGRQLMQAVLDRAASRGVAAVRLVQDAFNATSMALYASMGFEVRDPLVLIGGTPHDPPPGDVEVRALEEGDLDACAALHRKVHGVDRSGELRSALSGLGPCVVLRDGEPTAYASTMRFWPAAHGVARSDADLQALILGAASLAGGPMQFLLPTRQAALFRFCLGQGLRIIKPMTLMARGPYHEPAGRYFPSVGY